MIRLQLRPRSLSRSGCVGAVLLGVAVLVAVLGPFLAPHDPNQTIGRPYDWPGGPALLGTDFLGRDVLSRALDGGYSVLIYATIATAAAYVVGLSLGLLAGYSRGLLDALLMRTTDVLLSFPALIFVLVLAAAFGRGIIPVLLATVVVQVPAIVRIVRTATLEQTVQSYVEAAVVRGESAASVLRREVLPNISRTLAADVGLRFTWSVLLIASVNFLGLGLQPPASDWGLMISENRGGIGLNPAAVVVPAVFLGLLTVAINLISDSLADGP